MQVHGVNGIQVSASRHRYLWIGGIKRLKREATLEGLESVEPIVALTFIEEVLI